jgi:hypothetical protein
MFLILPKIKLRNKTRATTQLKTPRKNILNLKIIHKSKRLRNSQRCSAKDSEKLLTKILMMEMSSKSPFPKLKLQFSVEIWSSRAPALLSFQMDFINKILMSNFRKW